MTIKFYQQLAQLLKEGAVVLATVTRIRGSVPREVGAKMMICADGRTFYTIGGGAGEAKVIEQAQEVFQRGEKQIVEIDLSGTPERETQGVCGGLMQVLLECWSGEKAIALTEKIVNQLQSETTVILVTPFEGTKPYLLDPSIPILSPEQAFIETLQPPPTLLIIGAGHIGEQLAKLAQFVGFKIAIQDDRPEFANVERFPVDSLIFNDKITRVLEKFSSCEQLYITLVTRGVVCDIDALKIILNWNISYRYIGMIGSQKRIKTVFQELEESGIPVNQLEQIHAPIGLEIGAVTPEEIAISICAQLIQVRRHFHSSTC